MRKRNLLILLIQLIFIITAECLAVVSDQLEQANALTKNNQYEQAETIYLQIRAGNPGSDAALGAQKKLALIYLATNRQQQAVTASQQLITEFSRHKGITEAVWKIARGFNSAGNKEKANELHQHNVANYPKDKYAMWSQVEIVQSHIRDGDDVAADAAYNKLLNTFSKQPTLPKEIYQLAQRFSQAGKKGQSCTAL